MENPKRFWENVGKYMQILSIAIYVKIQLNASCREKTRRGSLFQTVIAVVSFQNICTEPAKKMEMFRDEIEMYALHRISQLRQEQ